MDVGEIEKFLKECDWWAEIHACTHRDVGAVVVKGGEIVAYGRNTMPGKPLCVNGGCPRGKLPPGHGKADYSDCVAVHAEMNAIIRAGNVLCNGSVLVVNSTPCHLCRRLAEGAGIAQIIYRQGNEAKELRFH